MPIQLIISDSSLAEDQLDSLTRDLCQTLSKATTIRAVIDQGEAMPGCMGMKFTAGVMVLSFLNGPCADVLKTFVLRSPTLVIEVKNGDKSVTINLQNVQDEQMLRVLGKLIKSEADG